MRNLSNISVKECRSVFILLGLKKIRTKGGHEAWMKAGMTRPAIIQSHVTPIPEFIMKNNLVNIGISKKDFLSLLEQL